MRGGARGDECRVSALPATSFEAPRDSNCEKVEGEKAMMKLKLGSLFCAVAIFGTASLAMAGAYGEPEKPEEVPTAPPVAHAATETKSDEFTPAPYLAVGGLYSWEIFNGDANGRNPAYGWGVNARAGYRFHPNVAVELLYENFIEYDLDPAGHINDWDVMANAKVFPFPGYCEPFVSVGLGVLGADAPRGINDGVGFAARFGVGADFYVTENIFLEAEGEYILPTGDVGNLSSLGLGGSIGYRFN
jgi:opacity protein-like surface antigen